MKKVVFYIVLAFLLLPMVMAYKINLDCNPGDDFDVTVAPGSTVNCDMVLVNKDASGTDLGGVKGFGADFLLDSSALPASWEIKFLESDGSYQQDSSFFTESVYPSAVNQLHLVIAESSRDATPAGSFGRLTFTAPDTGELLFFITPSMFGYWDGTKAVWQSCSEVDMCTETNSLNPVKVKVEKVIERCNLGDYDNSGTVTSADSLPFTWHRTFGDLVEIGLASSVDCGGSGESSCAVSVSGITKYICDDGRDFGDASTTCSSGCLLGDYDNSGTVTSADSLPFTWHRIFGDLVEIGLASSVDCGGSVEPSCAVSVSGITKYICDDGRGFGDASTICS